MALSQNWWVSEWEVGRRGVSFVSALFCSFPVRPCVSGRRKKKKRILFPWAVKILLLLPFIGCSLPHNILNGSHRPWLIRCQMEERNMPILFLRSLPPCSGSMREISKAKQSLKTFLDVDDDFRLWRRDPDRHHEFLLFLVRSIVDISFPGSADDDDDAKARRSHHTQAQTVTHLQQEKDLSLRQFATSFREWGRGRKCDAHLQFLVGGKLNRTFKENEYPSLEGRSQLGRDPFLIDRSREIPRHTMYKGAGLYVREAHFNEIIGMYNITRSRRREGGC